LKKVSRFISHSVLVALYKDLLGIGYCELRSQVGGWFKITEKSLSNKQKKLRDVFANWGGYSDWENAKRNVAFRKSVKNLELFIDMSDFKLTGKSNTYKKDPSWSYKENCPAQRYMTITDASTRIRYFRGRYTPKLYDGHFLVIL
jgi:hypothetical protein